MESSVFFKSQMSEKDYLYDFNTKQLTIVDPIVESLFNLDRQGKELSLFAVEHILSQKKSTILWQKQSLRPWKGRSRLSLPTWTVLKTLPEKVSEWPIRVRNIG